MSNDNTDPMIRARFHALELLVAHLVAERLIVQADAANSAAQLLTWLMARADRMKRPDVQPCEETEIRQEASYNLFETLNAALNFAGERQGNERPGGERPESERPGGERPGGERTGEAPCRRRVPGIDRHSFGGWSPDRPRPHRPR